MSEELTARATAAMPFVTVLGLEMVQADPGLAIGKAPWRAEFCTVGGALHGGYLMGLIDSVAAALTALNLPPDAIGTTTVESKTNFFKAVRSGEVTVSATLVHAGRTTVVVQSDVHDDSDRLICRATQTQLVLR